MKNYLVETALFIMCVLSLAFLIATARIYANHLQSVDNLIEVTSPIIQEMDTTNSLRNYEVLSDSLNNIYKRWLEDGTIK